MYKREIDERWNFRTANTKEYTHCYHTYPAMMIPQVARNLIQQFKPEGKFELLLDPYMGSGTSLVEASLCNIHSIGSDLNPLARMISRAKVTHFDIISIKQLIDEIIEHTSNFSPALVTEQNYSHISNALFWYSEDVLHKLSYIDQRIATMPESVQLFFQIALSETVREVSYTRNGEFKRFRMNEEKIKTFCPDVFNIFEQKIRRNLVGLKEYNEACANTNAEIYDFNTVEIIPNEIKKESIDMIVTSPPYGDSHTTVAYGQFSRWANEWFRFPNAQKLDNILMGGKKQKIQIFKTTSIETELNQIYSIDAKRYYEVIAFLNDYACSIANVSTLVRNGGRVCYVVGNRTVKGIQIPLDYFTAEIFEQQGFKHEITIVREIPNKRMPSKTSPTNVTGEKVSTMSHEYIVILTKK